LYNLPHHTWDPVGRFSGSGTLTPGKPCIASFRLPRTPDAALCSGSGA
jgi:hypothetical protein